MFSGTFSFFVAFSCVLILKLFRIPVFNNLMIQLLKKTTVGFDVKFFCDKEKKKYKALKESTDCYKIKLVVSREKNNNKKCNTPERKTLTNFR